MTTKHSEQLKAAAIRAGMIDPGDALALVDVAADKSATELVAELKLAKPFLFRRRASEMTPQEAAAALAELKRGPKPEPMPIDKTAKQMSARERETFLKEHMRRFG